MRQRSSRFWSRPRNERARGHGLLGLDSPIDETRGRAQWGEAMTDRFKRAFRLERGSPLDARASVSEELEHHFELVAEELISEGWDEAESRLEARRRFGDLEAAMRYCEKAQKRRRRDTRGRTMLSLDEMRQDLRYALRSIRKAPGYAGLVVLTLAFGIAANTTVFSVMNPYLFRPLPYEQPEALVQVNQVNPTTGWDMDRFSYPQYEDWKARTRAFVDLGAYAYGSANVTGREGPEQIQLSYVTSNMFDVLGAQAAVGRTFRAEEGNPGAEPVVVLDHGLWERRYEADPNILGRPIGLDGVQHTVIGIMPPDFNFPFGEIKLWVPMREAATANRASRRYILIGRFADGWSIDRADAELTAIQRELSGVYPDIDGRMAGVTVKPLREALNFAWDVVNILFMVLLGAVGFVLLIACANVASLTLARASGRRREVSVRAALGARRGRIVRQLLTESLVLALLGGAVGIATSYWVTGLLDPAIPEALFRIGAIDIDRNVLGFSVAVTLLTPIAFGLLPALSVSRADLASGLKEGSKGSGGLAASRGRRALVVVQVALAVVLITGAGLMLRSFASVRTLDLGFDPARVATVEVVLSDHAFESAEERRALMRQAVSAAGRVPGIESASAVQWLPLNHETIAWQIAPPSMAGAAAEEWPLATVNRVYPAYFETMSIARMAGRDLTPADAVDSEPVVVVNRLVADRYWPDGDAVGQSLLYGDPTEPSSATIVGIVEPVYHADLDPAAIGPQIYLPAMQASARRFFVVASTPSDPTAVVPPLRDAMAEVAPDLPLRIRPMNDIVGENQLQWSIASLFLGVFGGGALFLAMLGIYGLISYSVAQRRREIGVRIALGASAGAIRRLVVRDALRLTGFGLAIGLAAALGLGQLLTSALYGVGASDPITLAFVLTLFLVVAAVASSVPAGRASRTSPISVLRSQ